MQELSQQLTAIWGLLRELLGYQLADLGNGPITLGSISAGLLIFAVALAISRSLKNSVRQLSGKGRTRMPPSSVYTLERLAHYFVIILGLVIALSTMGVNFGKLALVASALSVGIGFGLQSIVSNFVSGLIILLERSLKVGDYVQLDNGVFGTVKEIRVRATVINTAENIDVIVPNSEFVNGKVNNWTHDDSLSRHRIPFGVAYGSDIEKLQSVAMEVALNSELSHLSEANKQPQVWMKAFGDSSLDFELLVWVKPEFSNRPGLVRSHFLLGLEAALREAGIVIPFPQRDVHMITAN